MKKIIKKKTAQAAKTVKTKQPKKKAVPPAVISSIGLHNLVCPKGSRKNRKLLGRGAGSGHGKTSTRGSKGQTSRTGRKMYPGFEGGQMPLMHKIAKRGFTSKFKKVYQIVNLRDLSGIKIADINLDFLAANNFIKDKNKLVKILADGEIKTPLKIQAHAASRKALEKVEAAGGKIELVNA